MIHQPVSVVLRYSLNAWLKEMASGDQRRLTASGSELEACRDDALYTSIVYFTLLSLYYVFRERCVHLRA